MKTVAALLALSLAAMAAPMSGSSDMEKRAPDFDQEIKNAGNIPAVTNQNWDLTDKEEMVDRISMEL
ncbi:hypothetical protein F4677DRAFT_440670 [Hypoxylon crocopeplum]|nr:hypothetical protein F4677DRAFT_440670 [Hypoxylon crocopeplum]